MKRPAFTVLTTPIPSVQRRAYRGLRRSLRRALKPRSPLPAVSPYPGHYALVRSVVEGLRSIGADFNYDPRTFGRLAPVVYAPANEALRQATGLKLEHRVDFLVAGPSNAFMPDEAGSILLSQEIDLVIVASEWVRQLYRAIAPTLYDKIRICPAGVDAEFWKPGGSSRASDVVVYWKSGDEQFCTEVERIIAQAGFRPVRIRYGSYTTEGYRRALEGAVFGVFLSSFETQGLALAEAWSMDVPTLVWNPRAATSWRGRSFIAGSSAPYLSEATGVSWVSTSELEEVISDVLRRLIDFRPREWVLSHMTDAACATALMDVIEAGIAGRA